jgi:hypothetical protein
MGRQLKGIQYMMAMMVIMAMMMTIELKTNKKYDDKICKLLYDNASLQITNL